MRLLNIVSIVKRSDAATRKSARDRNSQLMRLRSTPTGTSQAANCDDTGVDFDSSLAGEDNRRSRCKPLACVHLVSLVKNIPAARSKVSGTIRLRRHFGYSVRSEGIRTQVSSLQSAFQLGPILLFANLLDGPLIANHFTQHTTASGKRYTMVVMREGLQGCKSYSRFHAALRSNERKKRRSSDQPKNESEPSEDAVVPHPLGWRAIERKQAPI